MLAPSQCVLDDPTNIAETVAPKPPRWYETKYLCWGIGAFMFAGTIVSLSVVLTGSPNPIEYFIPVDPPGMTEAIRWDAENGLTMIVENACDDTWAKEFDTSIADWNQTDALVIRTRRTAHDPDCGEFLGRLRVCNSNYGETNWKGLNVVFMRDDFIVHSVSKLNDYWLTTETQRLYTMCHELGHGWGLPHTDENRFNRDRGDCMDYTERPQNNLRPGKFNMDLLLQMYGTRQQPIGSVAQEQEANQNNNVPAVSAGSSNNEKEDKKDKDKKDKDDRRFLRRMLQGEDDGYDAGIFNLYRQASQLMEAECTSEYCVRDIGNGYSVHIMKMLAY